MQSMFNNAANALAAQVQKGQQPAAGSTPSGGAQPVQPGSTSSQLGSMGAPMSSTQQTGGLAGLAGSVGSMLGGQGSGMGGPGASGQVAQGVGQGGGMMGALQGVLPPEMMAMKHKADAVTFLGNGMGMAQKGDTTAAALCAKQAIESLLRYVLSTFQVTTQLSVPVCTGRSTSRVVLNALNDSPCTHRAYPYLYMQVAEHTSPCWWYPDPRAYSCCQYTWWWSAGVSQGAPGSAVSGAGVGGTQDKTSSGGLGGTSSMGAARNAALGSGTGSTTSGMRSDPVVAQRTGVSSVTTSASNTGAGLF